MANRLDQSTLVQRVGLSQEVQGDIFIALCNPGKKEKRSHAMRSYKGEGWAWALTASLSIIQLAFCALA